MGWGTVGRFGTGRGTLWEVRDLSGDSRGGSGRVGELRDGSGDPRGGLGRSGDPQGGLGWVGRHSRRSETGRRTLREVRDGSRDVG